MQTFYTSYLFKSILVMDFWPGFSATFSSLIPSCSSYCLTYSAFFSGVSHSRGQPTLSCFSLSHVFTYSAEASATILWCEVPNFMNLHDFVPLLDCLLLLRRAPGSSQHALFPSMTTHIGAFQEWFYHFFLHTATAEGKRELSAFPHGQHGMEQTFRCENIHLRDAKVVENVLVCTRGAARGDIFARRLAAHQRIWN